MPETTTIWKIRDKATGEFSRGGFGSYQRFDDRGKVWRTKSGLANHIGASEYKQDVEVVEYEVQQTEVGARPIGQYKVWIVERRKRRIAAEKQRDVKDRIKSAEAELDRLRNG